MDPISIVGLVASSIAIVQAADRIGGLLGKLKPLFEAPREVEQLIKDVKSLRSLIINVSEAAKEMDRSGILPTEKLETLKSFVDEAEDILKELDRLIESFKKPSKGMEAKVKVHRGTWTRKVGEVERLRDRMRELRLSVAVELSTLHIFAVVRSSQSLDQLTLQAGQLLTEHSTTQRFLLQEFPEQRNMLYKLLEDREPTAIESSQDVEQTDFDAVDESVASHTHPAVILQNLRQKLESRYSCYQNCLCACHVPYQAGFSTQWTGSVSVRMSGMPYVTGSCDVQTCKKRSKARLQVHLGFPRWLLGRILSVSVLCDSFTQPSFNFQTLRVRHGGDLIFYYAERGNLDGIKRLFAEGRASILDVNQHNESLLILAIFRGQFTTVEFLLEQKSDPFLQDAFYQTPYAIAWENYAITDNPAQKQVISKFFPRNFDDERCNSRLSKLQMLITDQIQGDTEEEIRNSINDINHQDSRGNTALIWAVICHKSGIVKDLLSHGADASLSDFVGYTPLHAAAEFDSNSISLLLDAGVDPDVRSKYGETPLHKAAQQGHRDPGSYMSQLLEAKADMNARNNGGLTPLKFACMIDGNYATIEYLIEQGADINLPDYEGYSPIHSAIVWKYASYVDILLVYGAECCGLTSDGGNILHLVAYYGNIETMQVLFIWRRRLKGLDVYLKDKYGLTPLDWIDYRDEETSSEWVETFDILLTAILEVQDGVSDGSEESDGEEWITTDDDGDSQDEEDGAESFEDESNENMGEEESEVDEGSENFEDALEMLHEVGERQIP